VIAVDYSFARPSVASLRAAGVTDVFRYVGPPAWGKTITQAEYDELTGAGLRVWLVFEAGSTDAQGGENAGVANAHLALRYVPSGYAGPLWIAVDEAIDPNVALPYVRGFAGPVGAERTGVYGEGALIVLAHDAGVALAPGWQSASTSFPGNATVSADTGIVQQLGAPLPGTDGDSIVRPLIPAPNEPPPQPRTVGGTVTIVPISFTTNADGWTAIDCPLPPGKTPADVVSVICDAASAYDPQGWQLCTGAVDFAGGGPGVARIVLKSNNPNQFFTGRVVVAA
jgi:hypothetical protein